MDYWSKKYKNALDLDAKGDMRISLDLNGLEYRARNIEVMGKKTVTHTSTGKYKNTKTYKVNTVTDRFSLRDPKDINLRVLQDTPQIE